MFGAPVTIASGGYPNDVAVDGAGTVFYTNRSTVIELPFNGTGFGSPISISDQLAPGWSDPTGIAVDSAGNLFVLDYGNTQVVEVPWMGSAYGPGNVIGPSSDFSFPTGLAIDSSDNVYVADGNYNCILQLAYSSSGYGGPNYLGSGFVQVSNVAVDATGNVYAEDPAGGTISRIPWTGSGWGDQTTVVGGLNDADGIALDNLGNIYITAGFSQVSKFTVTNPPTLNFGTATNVGFVDTADGPQTVSLFNIGNQPLIFATPTMGSNPSYPAGFPANTSDGSLCTSGAAVAEAGSCDVSVNFQPTATGTNTGSLVFTDNAPASPQSIAVSGTGVGLGSQTIAFTQPVSPVYYGVSPIKLVATGGASGNPVTFSIVSGPGSLSGTNDDILTVTGVGAIVIAANQAGNSGYASAAQVTASITVLQPVPATIASPAAGSTLSGATVTFTWTAGTGVTEYDLHVGTTGVGSSNIIAGTVMGTSKSITGIPALGGILYFRLYSLINGAWQSIDYTFTEASPAAPAAMSSPTPRSKLALSSATFSWTTGSQVTQYDLHVGTTGAGSSNIFGGTVTGTSKTVTGIPTTSGTLNVRLYSLINGAWQSIDYTYAEQ